MKLIADRGFGRTVVAAPEIAPAVLLDAVRQVHLVLRGGLPRQAERVVPLRLVGFARAAEVRLVEQRILRPVEVVPREPVVEAPEPMGRIEPQFVLLDGPAQASTDIRNPVDGRNLRYPAGAQLVREVVALELLAGVVA